MFAMIHVMRRDVLQRFMHPLIVVPVHERRQATFQLLREPVVLQLDQVLHRPVIALDLPLRHGMIRLTPRVFDLLLLQVLSQLLGYITGTVIRQYPGSVSYRDLVDPGLRQGHIQRLLDIIGRHGGKQLPGQDIAAVVVHHSGQIVPAPTGNLEVGKVSLP